MKKESQGCCCDCHLEAVVDSEEQELQDELKESAMIQNIKPIEQHLNKLSIKSQRKRHLFKKGIELSKMCQVQVLIVISDPQSNRISTYQSGTSQEGQSFSIERATSAIDSLNKNGKRSVKVFTDDDLGQLDTSKYTKKHYWNKKQSQQPPLIPKKRGRKPKNAQTEEQDARLLPEDGESKNQKTELIQNLAVDDYENKKVQGGVNSENSNQSNSIIQNISDQSQIESLKSPIEADQSIADGQQQSVSQSYKDVVPAQLDRAVINANFLAETTQFELTPLGAEQRNTQFFDIYDGPPQQDGALRHQSSSEQEAREMTSQSNKIRFDAQNYS